MEIYGEEFIKACEEMKSKEEEDIRLFEQARERVQRKIKDRCVTNKDVIIDQEKEIMQYRNRIEQLKKINANISKLNIQSSEEILLEDGENNIDYITKRYYIDEKLVFEEEVQYK